MSDVPFEETSPNPENTEPPEFNAPAENQDPGRRDEYWACVQGVAPCSYHRAEMLDEMTRDAEPHADQVDTFGPPRTGQARLTKLDAEGKPTGESMVINGVAVNGVPTEPFSPAEAHEEMLNATGQRAGTFETIPEAHVALAQAGMTEFARFMADSLLAEAKADEASLRAMGAKGDGHDVIFEYDRNSQGLFGRSPHPRFRVLLRNVAAPVAMDVAMDEDQMTRWADLVQIVGQAMAECVNKIGEAVAVMQSSFEAQASYYQQTCPDAKPCMYQCPVSVGCSRGVQGPPDPDTLLREDGEPF